ncbi:MAG: SPOR domain-containing protein [Alcanivorax sp.]|uniref:SPOR domain-containing protein n=1 Tax=Alcanivorax sp. TaxID=1872427 RepID=UPI003DA77AE2
MEHDDDRFFSGASRGDYLDALTAHAGLGSVVALEGDSGSGVSTLLGHTVMALLGDMEIVRIDGAAEHNANVVVESLLRHFDIDRAALPDKLRETLVDGRILVVVDNSEDLLDEAVATMAALKQKLGARLGYLFGGLPGTVEKLKGADLALDDVLDLPSLVADDIQDFAWFVLGFELDEAEAERLRHDSDGNIARLLEMLRSGDAGVPVMSAASEEEDDAEPAAVFASRPVDDDSQEELHLSASAIDDEAESPVEAGADYEEDDQEQRAAVTPPWRHVAAVVGLLAVVVIIWSVFTGGSDDGSGQGASRQLALPVPEQSGAEEGAAVEAQEPQTRPLASSMEPVARLEDLPDRRAAEPDPMSDSDAGSVSLTPVTDPVMQSAPAREEQEVRVVQESAETVAPEPKEQSQEAPAKTPAEPDTVPASEPALSGLDAELGYQREDWLATLDDSRWFLQITVTSQEANARGVLDQLERRGAYYRAERNGKAVYLVLSGDYSSRQAALDAKSTLPAKLRSAGPFPRNMADIRNEL